MSGRKIARANGLGFFLFLAVGPACRHGQATTKKLLLGAVNCCHMCRAEPDLFDRCWCGCCCPLCDQPVTLSALPDYIRYPIRSEIILCIAIDLHSWQDFVILVIWELTEGVRKWNLTPLSSGNLCFYDWFPDINYHNTHLCLSFLAGCIHLQIKKPTWVRSDGLKSVLRALNTFLGIQH